MILLLALKPVIPWDVPDIREVDGACSISGGEERNGLDKVLPIAWVWPFLEIVMPRRLLSDSRIESRNKSAATRLLPAKPARKLKLLKATSTSWVALSMQ